MKVMQIMLSRGNGGAELQFADTVTALHRAGLDQVVVANPASARYRDLERAGLKLVPMGPWAQRMTVLARWRMGRLIRAERPDIVQCWMRRAATVVPRTGVPTIGWFGGYYDPDRFRSCGWFIGVTPGIVKHMVARGVPADRAFYVNTYSTATGTEPVPRAEFGTPAGAPVLLTLSRLHPKKGLDVAIAAAARIPDCHLWIAGDGPLQGELAAQAARLGVADRVRFLGWRNDRGALLRAADLCLLPSRYEPFGTVIIEAWEAGVPLVAATAAGPAETVRDGEDGILVPIDDADALEGAIRRVLGDAALRERLVATARARYAAEFTLDVALSRLRAIYETVAAPSR
ncbi:glycosyltransferase [Arenibaculum pallidiluteum]|uniref:glycosyltransferase n=1 Tax=Arenibaculum pallidiluteum TaxID=2812559 RepID=UPI001F1F3D3C|nr:glycosyltransferase [Arenibaculum pallidiluteum]